MDKKVNEIQKQLKVSMAFIKAADEVTAERAELKKRAEEQAANAAEERRRKKAEREAYQEWRRNNPTTEEEKAEQFKLRREYIDAYKQSLIAQLENTYILEPDGTKRKVGRKNEAPLN